jgi:hypothetical protein
MAKSSQLQSVVAELRKEEGLLRRQLGKVVDAIAALSVVRTDFMVRQGVRRAKKVSKNVRSMTDTQRKAVSARMKKYWAERRKAKR